MVKALFDTNILIDHLNAIPQARAEIARHRDKAISIVTWIEVMVGASPNLAPATQTFLEAFELVALDRAIADRAVQLRRQFRRIKLPDAVIWATAQCRGMIFVTRDTKTIPANQPGIRVPYTI